MRKDIGEMKARRVTDGWSLHMLKILSESLRSAVYVLVSHREMVVFSLCILGHPGHSHSRIIGSIGTLESILFFLKANAFLKDLMKCVTTQLHSYPNVRVLAYK